MTVIHIKPYNGKKKKSTEKTNMFFKMSDSDFPEVWKPKYYDVQNRSPQIQLYI